LRLAAYGGHLDASATISPLLPFCLGQAAVELQLRAAEPGLPAAERATLAQALAALRDEEALDPPAALSRLRQLAATCGDAATTRRLLEDAAALLASASGTRVD
ncbi:MAG: hypothetical protein QM617_14265, partial [Comamonas sp.]